MITVITKQDGHIQEFKGHLLIGIDAQGHPNVMSNLGLNDCVLYMGILLGTIKGKFKLDDSLYMDMGAELIAQGKAFADRIEAAEKENPGSSMREIFHK